MDILNRIEEIVQFANTEFGNHCNYYHFYETKDELVLIHAMHDYPRKAVDTVLTLILPITIEILSGLENELNSYSNEDDIRQIEILLNYFNSSGKTYGVNFPWI